VCTTELKEPCRACKAPLEPLWQVCPYCTAPVREPEEADLTAALTAEATLKTNGIPRASRRRQSAAS
jgi:predicted amidophosphoribosyltransferase